MTGHPRDKRWRERREVWVTPEQRFQPAGYSIDIAEEPQAKAYITRRVHHA